jgi:hypothetical protein
MIGNKIAILRASWNTLGLLFRKFACSGHDVTSKMFQTEFSSVYPCQTFRLQRLLVADIAK